MRGRTNFITIALSLFLVLALAGGIAFIFYYTNNLSTDLTTFCVQYGAQEIRRDTGRMQFDKGVYYTFKVNYPFGFPSSEKGERYKVSVEITEAGKEIEYKVDSRLTSLYPKPPDITDSFEIEKSDTAFTFRIPEDTTLESILRKAYEGKTVTEIPQVDFTVKDYLCLTVKSYDEKSVIKMGFGFEVEAKSQAPETQSPKPTETQTKPQTEPTATEYVISYEIAYSFNDEPIQVELPTKARAGETVAFTAIPDRRYEDYGVWAEVYDTSGTFLYYATTVSYGHCTFVMPAQDVHLKIYHV